MITEPKDLENIVRTSDDKVLYLALKQINFSYHKLVEFLKAEFYPENISRSEGIALFSGLMMVSEITFYRWKSSNKKVDVRDAARLAELIGLYHYGEEVFESRISFSEWLNTPNIHLDMKAPSEYMDNTVGLRYIHHLLDKIEYGAPV